MIDESFGQIDVQNRKITIVVKVRRYFRTKPKERNIVRRLNRSKTYQIFRRNGRKLKEGRNEGRKGKKIGTTKSRRERVGCEKEAAIRQEDNVSGLFASNANAR